MRKILFKDVVGTPLLDATQLFGTICPFALLFFGNQLTKQVLTANMYTQIDHEHDHSTNCASLFFKDSKSFNCKNRYLFNFLHCLCQRYGKKKNYSTCFHSEAKLQQGRHKNNVECKGINNFSMLMTQNLDLSLIYH